MFLKKIVFFLIILNDTWCCENRDGCFENGMLHCPATNGFYLPSITVMCNNLDAYVAAVKMLPNYSGGLRPENISFLNYTKLVERCQSICLDMNRHIGQRQQKKKQHFISFHSVN